MDEFIGPLVAVIVVALVIIAVFNLYVVPAVSWVKDAIASFVDFALPIVVSVLVAGAVLGGFTYMFQRARTYTVGPSRVGFFLHRPDQPYIGPTSVRLPWRWGFAQRPKFRLLSLTEKMASIVTNYGKVILTWQIDPLRLVQYLEAGGEVGVLDKIAEILHADPSIDLAVVGPRLGVVFVDPPKIGPPPDPDMFDPTVAMAALQPMLQSVDQIESARRTFFATYAELLSDPNLYARATRFFDDLLAKALRVR